MSKNTPSSEWIIEAPRKEEAAQLVALQARYWLDTYIEQGKEERNAEVHTYVDVMQQPERIALREQYIDRILSNPDAFYRVARSADGKIAGLLLGTKRGKMQHLSALYGSHSSALTVLLNAFTGWIDADLPVEAKVISDDTALQELYEQHGFTPVPETLQSFQESHHLFEITMIRKAQ